MRNIVHRGDILLAYERKNMLNFCTSLFEKKRRKIQQGKITKVCRAENRVNIKNKLG